jgi:hypothetical protein
MRDGRQRGGILAGLVVFLGMLAACMLFIAAVLASRVQVTETPARGETRVETPFGNVTVRERARLDPAALGVPVYPGSQRIDDTRKLASFQLDFGGRRQDLTVAVAEYDTRDSLADVAAFYRERLPGARVKLGREEGVLFQIDGGAAKKMVALRRRGGGTRISLASFTEAAAN